LVGLKRSVADSTISDSELQAASSKVEEPDYHDYYEKHFDQYYKEYQTQEPEEEEEEDEEERIEESSPKRISLDDRIELELGVKKDAPASQIPVFQFGQSNFGQFFGNQFYPPTYDYGQEKSDWGSSEPYQIPTSNPDARVLQVNI
jgi:hypothetical protein